MALQILQMLGSLEFSYYIFIILTDLLPYSERIAQSNLPDIHELHNQAPHSNTHCPLQALQRKHLPGMFQYKQAF